jgi:hypothetical protein
MTVTSWAAVATVAAGAFTAINGDGFGKGQYGVADFTITPVENSRGIH